jgi:hypothetical protein
METFSDAWALAMIKKQARKTQRHKVRRVKQEKLIGSFITKVIPLVVVTRWGCPGSELPRIASIKE